MKKTLAIILSPFFLYGTVVDFSTSLEKTLQNNKSLKAKKLEVEKSKLDLKEAQGYNFGSLIFNENISYTNHAGYVFGMKMASREATFGDFGFDEFISGMGTITPTSPTYDGGSSLLATAPDNLNNPKSRTNYETKLTYKLPIFTGNKISNGKKMAQLQILANEAKYKFDQKALGLEVLKAYNGAVASKEFIKATKKAKEATSSFVNFANELFNEGLVTNIDVKQAMVYDMGVEAQMIEAQNKYELSLSYLRFLTDDKTISDVAQFKRIDLKNIDNDEPYLKRDDYIWMKYNTQTMKAKIDFDSYEKYPMIGAQVEYGYNDDSFTILDATDHHYYLAAIGVEYKLFDGSVTKTKEEKAKIEFKKTQHYLNYMEDGISLEIEKNKLNLQAKQKILTQKQKALSLSDEVLVQASQMYKNHLINMSDLLMQQANQQKASAEAIYAKYEKSIAAATLKLSLGNSLKDDNTKE